MIERVLSIDAVNRLYCCHSKSDHSLEAFFEECLGLLNIGLRVTDQDLRNIPGKGPLVVIANHPFGGLEGIILGYLISRFRPDVKIMGNFLLQHITEIQKEIIPVNPFGSKQAVPANASALKTAIKWVKAGGAPIIFPSGEVSHFQPRAGKISDPPWRQHLGALVLRSKAKVLPVFFPGSNSIAFHMASLFHPKLRTALLARELMKKADSTIPFYIGKSIPWQKIRELDTPAAVTEHLRSATYFLRYRSLKEKKLLPTVYPAKNRLRACHRIADPVPAKVLEKEVKALAKSCLLLQRGEFDVYVAVSRHIPNLLKEIGRLREISFRSVQEGTGKPVDIDRFDAYYLHLFLWNRFKKEVIGAYRIGRSDKIVNRYGLTGLYTNSLFRFKPELLDELSHALELGRSFIRPEYQRKPSSLSLLWCGIGAFISQQPRYRVLFGPVSISQNYHIVSKTLMVEFLRRTGEDSKLSSLVKPRHPFRPGPAKHIVYKSPEFIQDSIEHVSLLISGIEEDGKGVPILTKHYLNLDGKFVAFNVDRKFSNVVDGLVFVDLTVMDPRILKRFMGQSAMDHFLSYHNRSAPKAA